MAVTRGLAWAVHGLCVTRKSRRQPLLDALEAIDTLLQTAGCATNQPEPSPAHVIVREEDREGGAANGRSGGLTRLVGQLNKLAVDGGGDAVLARMQEHVNSAFLSMMTRLKAN